MKLASSSGHWQARADSPHTLQSSLVPSHRKQPWAFIAASWAATSEPAGGVDGRFGFSSVVFRIELSGFIAAAHLGVSADT